ncbi:hypothetical protein [Nocardia abscessus]|uniref:hypothetical protein n=1 Tax=Nocardia abscessus TaxID=120957 RepID=UPI000318223F|nr:hypothetical protein [Nocardia abscessus]MCC3328223.1 hypothetical protein [Nocardia abscessus]
MTTTAGSPSTNTGAPDPSNGASTGTGNSATGGNRRPGLISPRGFGWIMIAVIAGLIYGNVTRATGCPMAGAAGAGTAAAVAVLYWLEQFDWYNLLTTRRGWILIAASIACAIAAACIPTFAIPTDDIWITVLGVITAAGIGFGAALAAADHFVDH